MYIRESWLEKYSRFCSVKACLSALGSGSSTVCLPLSVIFGFIGRCLREEIRSISFIVVVMLLRSIADADVAIFVKIESFQAG